jgi:hypothetical protein
MNDEIPYNPPGMDEYIAEGARHNSELLKKWAKEDERKAKIWQDLGNTLRDGARDGEGV